MFCSKYICNLHLGLSLQDEDLEGYSSRYLQQNGSASESEDESVSEISEISENIEISSIESIEDEEVKNKKKINKVVINLSKKLSTKYKRWKKIENS